ncbi:MAG: DUF1343 domain-containing protein [Verrucomicrobiota bacterium]
MKTSLRHGIDVLIEDHPDWLAGRRVGLVAHPASAGAAGTASAELLRQVKDATLVSLFGPEHGFGGRGGAGEEIASGRHPEWGLPIHSLYGETRRPTPEMLSDLDVIVFDLQDLGARPYTYVSTLLYVLQAAAEHRKSVIVADRPVPLAHVVDGPMLNAAFQSFVGCVRTPVVYGMTPGEMAVWLQRDLELSLDLRVAKMTGYRREAERPSAWPPWIPPSPAIPTWESGLCFPITVFFEALPAIDHGRGTETPFELLGAPWLKSDEFCKAAAAYPLPGIEFASRAYKAGTGVYRRQRLEGLRIRVTGPKVLRPVATAVTILHLLQEIHGAAWLWSQPGTRQDFFDRLMGTDTVRLNLQDGLPPLEIVAAWERDLAGFRESRRSCLMYS